MADTVNPDSAGPPIRRGLLARLMDRQALTGSLPEGWPRQVLRYTAALAAVGAALGATLLLQRLDLDIRATIFVFYIAVVAGSWLGTGPGWLSVVLSVLTVEFFWTPPEYSFEVLPEELPWFAPFVLFALITMGWSTQRKRTESALAQARDTLEITVQQRTAELLDANKALRKEVAERQAAENEVRRRETLLAQGQKLSRTGSWTLRPETGEMRWSAGLFEIAGLANTVQTPSYRLLLDRIHPDDRAPFAEDVTRAAATAGAFSCEMRLLLPDGSTKYAHSVGEAHGEGDRLEIIGTVMDLTQRKQTEEALFEAEAKLAHTQRLATAAELTATIAHEINQPLAAIVVNAGACLRSLARQPPNLDGAREALDCIVSDGRRAADVVANVRALLGRRSPHYGPLDLNAVIGEVLDLMRGTIERQRIALRTQLAPDLPPVIGDRVQLQQVLINLVVNAAEAMQGNSRRRSLLTLASARADNEPDMVAVTVEDTGSGLPAEKTHRIFESFFSTKPDGIGVGLSISRSIVEAHGGMLSAAPGKRSGARFRFTVPVAAAENEPPAPIPGPHI